MRFSILPIFLLSLASSVLAAPSAINDAADLSARSAEEVDVDKRTFSQLTCPRGWNKGLFKCCPPGAFDILGQCKCLDIRTTLSRDGQRCENKCSQSDWKWCNTQCCPPGSDENRWGQCEVSPFPFPFPLPFPHLTLHCACTANLQTSCKLIPMIVLRKQTTSRIWKQQAMCG